MLKEKINENSTRDMFEVVLYYEKFETISDIRLICDRYKTIKKYIIAHHDKDLNKDGEPLKPHFHVFVKFQSSQKLSMIMKWFDANLNQCSFIKGRWNDAVLYATHLNSPDKYQYGDDAIISNFDYKTILANYNARLSIQKLCDEVMTGDLPLGVAKKQIVNSGVYDKLSAQLDNAHKLYLSTCKGKRDLEVLYVWGPSGSGKTRWCLSFCQQNNLDYFISSSSNDPLQGYENETVLILDDCRSTAFTFADWLKLLDIYISSVKSRFANKTITSKIIIITSPYPPTEFFEEVITEDLWQFYRRINGYLHVGYETISVFNPMTLNSYGQYTLGSCIYTQPNIYKEEKKLISINSGLLKNVCDTWAELSKGKLPYEPEQLSLFDL